MANAYRRSKSVILSATNDTYLDIWNHFTRQGFHLSKQIPWNSITPPTSPNEINTIETNELFLQKFLHSCVYKKTEMVLHRL